MKALRVLIVEDEAFIAMLFAEVLTEMGHEVCASEATEAGAIATAKRCQPDLIIADIRLREGSGINAMQEILRSGFIPHLFVSGDMIDRTLISPAAGTLQKPFYEPQLIKAIARAIDPANILVGQKHATQYQQPRVESEGPDPSLTSSICSQATQTERHGRSLALSTKS